VPDFVTDRHAHSPALIADASLHRIDLLALGLLEVTPCFCKCLASVLRCSFQQLGSCVVRDVPELHF
jgi:hypothetical protein